MTSNFPFVVKPAYRAIGRGWWQHVGSRVSLCAAYRAKQDAPLAVGASAAICPAAQFAVLAAQERTDGPFFVSGIGLAEIRRTDSAPEASTR